MSEKYFAKHLPVEGEVKFANSVSCPAFNLSLCSRDIQIGDEVWEEGIDSPIGEEVLKIAHDGIYGNVAIYRLEDGSQTSDFCTNLFKVIGEISKAARWVKEGDEFDEDQIQRDILTKWYAGEDDYTEYCHYHPKGNEKFVCASDEEFICEHPIKIICPCCGDFK